jgi:ABC-type transport system involved in multi-copper enzyme maturation permease subunit
VSGVLVIARYAVQESLRRRVFLVVLVLSTAFLGLYAVGVDRAFHEVNSFVTPETPLELDPRVLAGATVFGLSMFATLFLGAVLVTFLTFGAVRNDAEQGLLQPLVVRPIGRASFLAGRFLGAASIAVVYVSLVYGGALLLTGLIGHWWPDRIALPGLELAGAVVILAALSLLGSVFLSGTANGIAVFMVLGAGLVAGLLGQIGRAIGSGTLRDVSRVTTWILPFEALYQDALHAITEHTVGFTQFALRLGPFGGAERGGTALLVWSGVYVVLVGTATVRAFARKDL